MLNVRLAGDHLFGKLLFTWLSLVMSMMVSFVLSFFPRDVLDEILNLIGSVSEGFPSYSFRGGRVERRCWVNFQCRGVLLVWKTVGQGPIALAVGAGGGLFGHFFSRLSFLFSFSLSVGDGSI